MSVFKLATTFAIVLLSAGGAQAQIYDCARTHLSAAGFTSSAAAASWFPEQIAFSVTGDTAESGLGQGTVEPDGNRLLITFDADGTDYKIRLFPTKNRASVWVDSGAGYVQATPSSYSCRPR